ncbi:YtpR family tRNA-binding protein [Convivina intestini]|uniref:tRNA-binding protein n=1 Tax=Convivina intestini TaxID=1505726 RepID=A0A2U1DC10_9LACO|nr:DUF4479 domain-containing protein [Convivina intestini]PVY85200.1 tRNA-binding protein [Convivina intestini]CAH1852394.1 hypothetical protein R077811_00417 [Convivina intestini]CAH1854578.1 hypothetical protein R078131_01001 [Convivina intestini]SDC00470.1 tRNA-binding protein [Leuconostocaceae bacterium R-53105]
MITTYNPQVTGDVLMITLGPSTGVEQVNQQDQVVQITDANTDEVVAFNIFDHGQELGLGGQSGQIFLDQQQVDRVNAILAEAGFTVQLAPNPSKLTIGYVESVAPHPDSDHLQITQTAVGQGQNLQIVSGSPNMKAGIKVVVAQPGSMMPSGSVIWAGELRGIPSAGMIVSGRELQLPGAPNRPGALVLPDDFGEVGEVFDFNTGRQLYQDGKIDTNY